MTSTTKDMGKGNCYDKNANECSHYENYTESSITKQNIRQKQNMDRSTTCLRYTILGSKDFIAHYKDSCISMFIAAHYVVARKWDQSRCPSTQEWLMRMWLYCQKPWQIDTCINLTFPLIGEALWPSCW